MSIALGPALHPAHLISELKTRRRESVLGELLRRAQALGAVHEPEVLRVTLLLRERLGSTAVGHGVALPNARSLLVLEPMVLVGRSSHGIDWEAGGGGPVRLVLLVLSPAATAVAVHLAAVGRAAAAVRPARARQRFLEGACPDEIAALLSEAPG